MTSKCRIFFLYFVSFVSFFGLVIASWVCNYTQCYKSPFFVQKMKLAKNLRKLSLWIFVPKWSRDNCKKIKYFNFRAKIVEFSMFCMWIFPSKSRFLAWKLKLSVKIWNLIRILASKSKLLNKKIHNFGHFTRENSNLRPNLILAQKFKLTIFLVLVSTSIFEPKKNF